MCSYVFEGHYTDEAHVGGLWIGWIVMLVGFSSTTTVGSWAKSWKPCEAGRVNLTRLLKSLQESADAWQTWRSHSAACDRAGNNIAIFLMFDRTEELQVNVGVHS